MLGFPGSALDHPLPYTPRRQKETRYRRRQSEDAALEAITPRLRRRVRKAAELWMQRHDRSGRWQPAFDVVIVTPGRWPRRPRDALPFE